MNRFELALTLFAAGFIAALLGTGLTSTGAQDVSVNEAKSALLDQRVDRPPSKDAFADTGATVKKWGPSGGGELVQHATFRPGRVKGVLTGLQVPDLQASSGINTCTLSVSAVPGGPVTYCSVTSGVGSINCSTGAGGVQPQCSVNGTNPSTMVPAYCSTTASTGTGTYTYCSANAQGTVVIVACSSSGAGTGVGSANACSAGYGPTVGGTPVTVTCSTSASLNPGNGATNCSAGLTAGSTFTTCSSGSASGAGTPNPGNCSASNAGGGTPTGSCSVLNDGAGNYCSTTQGSGSTCTVLSGGAGKGTMTCSIQSTFASAYCTANYPGYGQNPSGASCSAFPASIGGCSVLNTTTGTVTGPNPTTGYCGTPPT